MNQQFKFFTVLLMTALVSWSTLSQASPESSSSSWNFVSAVLGTHVEAQVVEAACPAGFPLDCANGQCCPADYTLYCPQLSPKACINPSKLTDEQLKTLAANCSPLLSCR
jgi:hypothetical protein